MKRKFSLVFVLLVMAITAVHSQNHMDLIMTLTGEYVGSEYGTSVVSMDFNGDGYDDLIVKAALWHPEHQVGDYQRMYGKIYFYWGGPDLSDQPDFVIEGQHPLHFSGYTYSSLQNHMINAGDMNGDGIDDLVIPQRLADGTRTVSVYFGRAIPQTEPDIELYYPQPDTRGIFVYPLGDINGDGKDDISILLIPGHTVPAASILIWTDVFDNPVLFRTSTAFTDLCGVGDVNGDGFADMVHYNQVGEERSFSFYYGNETCSMADSLLIGTSSEPVDRYAGQIGDVNGDGIPDFVSWKNKIWLGDSVIDSEPDIAIDIAPWLSFSYGMWPHIVHGDFNGDGYDDFAASDNRYAGMSGQAAIWLGSPNMNGTRDLALNPPDSYSYRNFGWSKAAGDFNGDGYCDLAVSAPIWTQGHTWYTAGKVFIYAGNAELTDTTAANEDDVLPPALIEDWRIDLYPNPTPKDSPNLQVAFSGDAYSKVQDGITLQLYNLKGQRLFQKTLNPNSLQKSLLELKLNKYPAGIYVINIKAKGNTKYSKRFCLM